MKITVSRVWIRRTPTCCKEMGWFHFILIVSFYSDSTSLHSTSTFYISTYTALQTIEIKCAFIYCSYIGKWYWLKATLRETMPVIFLISDFWFMIFFVSMDSSSCNQDVDLIEGHGTVRKMSTISSFLRRPTTSWYL